MLIADNLNQLLEILPKFISIPIEKHKKKEDLTEIILDLGRRPEVRFSQGCSYLSYRTIVWQDLAYIIKRLGNFSGDNRAGIEKTLHRISSLRNRQGAVVGLTCRIGRAIFGTVNIIRDLLESEKSILLLGRPGIGKTTAIREIARVLSDGLKKRVIIIDTSNEIAGDGDLPHPSIGKARRMQVSNPQNQHQIMIEAVENHMPEIIIIDEIGTELEAEAARTIAERGVQLVGTAHGTTLENLTKNPTLTDLIGGIEYVTLGDEEAKRRGSSKMILERKASPTFHIAIELHDVNTWIIHENLEQSIDSILQGYSFPLQQRTSSKISNSRINCEILFTKSESKFSQEKHVNRFLTETTPQNFLLTRTSQARLTKGNVSQNEKHKNIDLVYIYIHGINISHVRSLINLFKLPISIVSEIQSADSILTLSSLVKKNKKLVQISHSRKISIHTISNITFVQLTKALQFLIKKKKEHIVLQRNISKNTLTLLGKKFLTPLEETRLVSEDNLLNDNIVIDLLDRTRGVRKIQYKMIKYSPFKAITVGSYPYFCLRLLT